MTNQSILIVEDLPEIAARLSRAVEATAGLSLAGVAGTLDQGIKHDLALPDSSPSANLQVARIAQ